MRPPARMRPHWQKTRRCVVFPATSPRRTDMQHLLLAALLASLWTLSSGAEGESHPSHTGTTSHPFFFCFSFQIFFFLQKMICNLTGWKKNAHPFERMWDYCLHNEKFDLLFMRCDIRIYFFCAILAFPLARISY